MWMSGYTLQWMMSFDNMFVFHLIFKVYKTPDTLKHRPLFLGILGAAFFTLTLLTVGEVVFHKLYFLHVVFGVFFIYIGVQQVAGDDDDDDPSQNPVVQWLERNLRLANIYDTEGHFFVRLPVDDDGRIQIPECAQVTPEVCCDTDPFLQNRDEKEEKAPRQCSIVDLSKIQTQGRKTELRATLLFLVVCTIEISDVIFSVDTIVAISSQVNELFLAFTCVIFSLLTLRATFFMVDVLVQMFSLLKYGVAAILIYIGIKLTIDRFVLVPHLVDCLVLVTVFGLSMIAYTVYDHREQGEACEIGGAADLLSKASPPTS